MPEPKTFYIIDGHAQIYRAYFAPFRDLTGPGGEPTKATFVFTQWLINLIQNRKPDYLAMTMDSGDETVFRKQISPTYKANRQPPPDDFFPQERRILQIVRAAGIPVFAKPGYEADDLIATMVRRLADEFHVVIVSKDKDLRQLINARTRLYDWQSDAFMDEARMLAEVGYAPAQAIDVQTLMGDSIDNVAGIPGVGEKTAARLLKTYGSIDAIVKNVDQLTPKLRENFLAHADKLPITRQLVTLKADVEFEFEAQGCASCGLDMTAIRPHLESLGFTSLLKRLGEGGKRAAPTPRIPPGADLFSEAAPSDVPAPETAQGCDYQLVHTPDQFEAFLAELRRQKRFAFDTETDALGAVSSGLIGMSFSWKRAAGGTWRCAGRAGRIAWTARRCCPRCGRSWKTRRLPKSGTTSNTICR